MSDINPYLELTLASSADDYAAQIIDQVGWVKVAQRIRKNGWREETEDLIGRIERAMTWRGHAQYVGSLERLSAARDALLILRVAVGVEAIPYMVDRTSMTKIEMPDSVRKWVTMTNRRALANHPTLGWIGFVAKDDTADVIAVMLGTKEDLH